MKKLIAAAILLSVLILVIIFAFRPPTPPNIVLMVVDSLRADSLGCYGAAPSPSPFIDSLARRGIIYENVMPQATDTFRSSVSYMTGKYPQEVIGNHDKPVPVTEETFVSSLKQAGYYCEAYNANPDLSHGLMKDFQVSRNRGGYVKGESIIHASAPVILEEIQATFPYLQKPYFLYVHLMDVHSPYVDESVYDLIDPEMQDDIKPYLENKKIIEQSSLFESEPELARALYVASIRYFDKALQTFANSLPKDTIIIITADHGRVFDEQQDRGGDEIIPVPLIVYGNKTRHSAIKESFELRNLRHLIEGYSR